MLKFGGIAAVEAPMDPSAVSQYRSVTLFPLLAVTYYPIVSLQMDHLVRQEHGRGKCYGSHEPRRDPSIKSKRTSIDQKTPDMSSSSEVYENSVQVVENLIDSDLIDNAVAELQSGATSATDEITTRMNWTPACEKLREFYATNVHPKVGP